MPHAPGVWQLERTGKVTRQVIHDVILTRRTDERWKIAGMPEKQDDHEPADELDLELEQLLKRIEDEPISDELRLLAKKLQDALTERNRGGGPD
jgi:hypothetical protein